MLGGFVSVQVVVQVIGAASGILLVRTLSRTEYAYFTIANSMQATMSVLADTGLTIGLFSMGSKVSTDPFRFGQLVATTLHLRRYLVAIAATVITPIMIWTLLKKGSSVPYAGALTFAVLLTMNFQLTTSVLMAVPRLLFHVGRLQRLDLLSALVRIALLGALYFLLLNAATAFLATLAMFAVQYFALRRIASTGIDLRAPISSTDRTALLGIVKNQAPTTIFYCLQGQLTVWLMALVGTTKNVAELGALGRLGIIFSVVASVMTTIVLPRFARYHTAQLLRRRYLQILCAFVLFGAVLVTIAAAIPGPLLWILGAKYALLKRELALMMMLTVLNAIAEAMWSLNASKGWIAYVWLNIPGTICVQLVLLLVFDVSSVRGVLEFGVLSFISPILVNVILTFRGLRSTARQEQALYGGNAS